VALIALGPTRDVRGNKVVQLKDRDYAHAGGQPCSTQLLAVIAPKPHRERTGPRQEKDVVVLFLEHQINQGAQDELDTGMTGRIAG